MSNIVGTAGNDTLTGTTGDDVITGLAGNDTLNGGAGNDELYGGDGDDILTDPSGATGVLDGGAGNDRISIGFVPQQNGQSAIVSASQTTVVSAGVITGGDGDDVISVVGGIQGGIDGGAGLDSLSLLGYSSFSLVGINIQGIESLSVGSVPLSGSGSFVTGSPEQFESFDRITLNSQLNSTILLPFLGITLSSAGVADLYDEVAGIREVRITGSAGDDRLVTGDNTDMLSGGTGNDTLEGRGSQDLLFGGEGDDALLGGDGNDILDGGAGDDIFDGGDGSDTVRYSTVSNNSTIFTTTDTIQNYVTGSVTGNSAGAGITVDLAISGKQDTGGGGLDQFINIENILGSSGADVFRGDAHSNILVGAAGNDQLSGGDGDDFLYGDGNGVVTNIPAPGTGFIINSGVVSGTGNDVLDGGAGNDLMDGGGGIDTATYANATAGVAVNLLLTAAQDTGGAGIDTLLNIENLIGSAFNDTLGGNNGVSIVHGGLGDDFIYDWDGADQLFGDEGNDVLLGGIGDDTLRGGDGSDTLSGGLGADILDGGAGQDNAYYGEAGTSIIAFLGSHSLNAGAALGDVYVDIEILTGTDFADILGVGDRAAIGNVTGSIGIGGGGGNDLIFGSNLGDYLNGGAGDDTLQGQEGGDFMDGGDGIDTASFETATAGVSAFFDGAAPNTGEAAGDYYFNFENFTGSAFNDTLGGNQASNQISGGAGDDWLYGRAGTDILDGGTGNDTLDGGSEEDYLAGRAGDDILIGGSGNDVLEGGAGADAMDGGTDVDVAYYRNAASGVVASMLDASHNTGDAAGDTYTNVENLWGSDFNDTLTGSAGGGQVYGFTGADTLIGQSGADVFYGGLGADTITTGGGADDIFYLRWDNAGFEGGDTITDFTSGVDHITVSRYWFGFGGISGSAASLTAADADFVTSGAGTSGHPTFIWNAATGVLQFDADGTGAATAVTIATLQGGASLHLSDIWSA